MTIDLMTLWTLCLYAFGIAGSATAGVAVACWAFNWAPVNITLNMHGIEITDEDES